MDTAGQLHQAYVEWRRLAEAEGQAIRSGNWSFVAECQQALSQLQGVVDTLSRKQPQTAGGPGPDAMPPKSSQRSTVLELIELQRRNLSALQQRRQRLSNHIEQLARTGRNLRGIQRSYAPANTGSWSSYS